VHELLPSGARASAAVLCQPSRQVGRSTEIQQRLGQGLQLLQWQERCWFSQRGDFVKGEGADGQDPPVQGNHTEHGCCSTIGNGRGSGKDQVAVFLAQRQATSAFTANQ
jgi:hypothetical protein